MLRRRQFCILTFGIMGKKSLLSPSFHLLMFAFHFLPDNERERERISKVGDHFLKGGGGGGEAE